uniref:Uncharacterized protein n=1 Tax=Plectus sambesii TaxID=2011161 RepID=A0A914VBG8_9BILA
MEEGRPAIVQAWDNRPVSSNHNRRRVPAGSGGGGMATIFPTHSFCTTGRPAQCEPSGKKSAWCCVIVDGADTYVMVSAMRRCRKRALTASSQIGQRSRGVCPNGSELVFLRGAWSQSSGLLPLLHANRQGFGAMVGKSMAERQAKLNALDSAVAIAVAVAAGSRQKPDGRTPPDHGRTAAGQKSNRIKLACDASMRRRRRCVVSQFRFHAPGERHCAAHRLVSRAAMHFSSRVFIPMRFDSNSARNFAILSVTGKVSAARNQLRWEQVDSII